MKRRRIDRGSLIGLAAIMLVAAIAAGMLVAIFYLNATARPA